MVPKTPPTSFSFIKAGNAMMADRKSIISKMALQFARIFTLNPSPLIIMPLAYTFCPNTFRIQAACEAMSVVNGL